MVFPVCIDPFLPSVQSILHLLSVGKLVLIELKRKSHMGLISHAISVMITFNFKHFLFVNLLMLL